MGSVLFCFFTSKPWVGPPFSAPSLAPLLVSISISKPHSQVLWQQSLDSYWFRNIGLDFYIWGVFSLCVCHFSCHIVLKTLILSPHFPFFLYGHVCVYVCMNICIYIFILFVTVIYLLIIYHLFVHLSIHLLVYLVLYLSNNLFIICLSYYLSIIYCWLAIWNHYSTATLVDFQKWKISIMFKIA